MQKTSRETFSSGLAIFFATLGSAVGLGNIWRFPSVTGSSGGAAFLLIYLACVAFVGIPVMVAEFSIGRMTRKNAVGAMNALKRGRGWKVLGWAGVLSAFLIMFFYSDVAGWVYAYIFKAATGSLVGLNADTAGKTFGTAAFGTVQPLIWQWVVLVVVASVISFGVKKGIEKVTKTLMPVLFLLIIICGIRSLTLSGASEGISFLFVPDFSKITGTVLLSAMGLAFFKLSLGMGCMITYSSYFRSDENLPATAAKVAFSDTLVSLLAGIAIFPAVFSFGLKPDAGPGLLFMTIPMVFSQMPFGQILLTAFFVLSAIAATTAMISLVEVPVAFFTDELGWSRARAAWSTVIAMGVIGSLATLSADASSPLGGLHILGYSFFDLFDVLSSKWLLPIGGFMLAVLAGYLIPFPALENELTNQGSLKLHGLVRVWRIILRYVTPLMLLAVFLNTLGVLKF